MSRKDAKIANGFIEPKTTGKLDFFAPCGEENKNCQAKTQRTLL